MKSKSFLLLISFLINIPVVLTAKDCYESRIVNPSPFMGNNGEIFKLEDGSVWEVKYEYEYLYEYYPSVIVCPNRGIMLIDDKELNVEIISPGSSNKQTENKNSNTWKVSEETYLQGTISGTIRKGHIFKTTSGSIYEVTDMTLQIVIEIMPEVIVLRNGDVYKLVVEGFDETLICKKLK